MYKFKGPAVGNYTHMVLLTIDRQLSPGITGLTDFADVKIKMVLRCHEGAAVGKNKVVALKNIEAHELIFTWTIGDNLTQYIQYFFVFDGDRGLTYSCVYTEASFEKARNIIKNAIVKILPKEEAHPHSGQDMY